MFGKKAKSIGVDVGGTKILLQTFNKKGEDMEEEKCKTNTSSESNFVDDLIILIERYFHRGIESIGIALPGIVDQKKGVLVQAPHLPVKNLELQSILQERFRRPIILENDINAFLYAQSHKKELRHIKNMVGVMVGTGVGGAIMTNGELYRGQKGFAGEIGHTLINAEGNLKTLEQNVAGSSISKIAKELGIKARFSSKNLNDESVDAKIIKKYLVEQLGIGLANLSLIFDPEAIILGGSIYKLFLKKEKKALEKIIKKHSLNKTSPQLIDADEKYSVALGIALMSQNK